MINDQIEAYRRAVETRAKAEVNWHNDPDADTTELRACREEEQLRLDGLHSVIGMLLQEYAAEEPFNPFSINGDINQPPVQPPSHLPPPIDNDPQDLTFSPKWTKVLSPPPPREDK